MNNDSFKHIRKLTIALIISGTLNIAFIGAFFYWVVREQPPTPYFELKPAKPQEQQAPLSMDRTSKELIEQFKVMPFEALTKLLSNTQLVENGYAQRDIALACLTAFHHFDLERALSRCPLPSQKRILGYSTNGEGGGVTIVVNGYPGLTDAHYKEIGAFINTERWPFTSKGLFLLLQNEAKSERTPSLADAFAMTPEYQAAELLFARAEHPVERKELLEILLVGDWNMLSSFYGRQKLAQDLSAGRRERFLLDYMEKRSKQAAYLLLKIDSELAPHRLDDAHVLLLLELLDQKSSEAEKFALNLLTSPRSDAVWQKAAAQLYRYAGEAVPERSQHHAALKRFLPTAQLVQQTPPAQLPAAIPAVTAPASKPPESKTPEIKAPPPSKTQEVVIPPKKSPVKPIQPPIPNKKPLISSTPHRPLPAPKKADAPYSVQEGDSLWKIAKKFNVDLERLRAYNHLESDSLQPGTTLLIPKE